MELLILNDWWMYLFEILYDLCFPRFGTQNGINSQLSQHHYHQQTEMKVTNSLQQPYSFSLAQQGSFLAEDLPPSSLPRQPRSFTIFQAAFPHKLVQYPKNISIWHTHAYPFLIQICGFHCTTLTQKYRFWWEPQWPLNCWNKFDQNHHSTPPNPKPTRGYHGSKFTVWRFSFGDGSLAISMVAKYSNLPREMREHLQHAFGHKSKIPENVVFKRNGMIDHVPKLGQHTSKPSHLDFIFLSGATEKSGKFEAHPQFSSISHPNNFTSKTSWPFLHLLKKLRCIFFSCEDAKLKLGWIVGILHGWIDNNLSSRCIIKVLYLMT